MTERVDVNKIMTKFNKPPLETVANKKYEQAAEYLLRRELVNEQEKKAVLLVEKLQEFGYESYLVGGYVRDIMLGLQPKDIDIATAAPPEKVIEMATESGFKVIEQTENEAKNKVVRVIVNGDAFEITTFRKESNYQDGRHPTEVSLATSAFEDAKRRDFTFNALYFDPKDKRVIDFFGGLSDLENKILRFVGEPEKVVSSQREVAYERIVKEDHLRILRAVRFAARFGLEVDKGAEEVIRENAHLLREISAERVRDELDKMFMHQTRVEALKQLDNLEILPQILPELVEMKGVEQPVEFHQEGDVWTHTKLCFASLEKVFAEENEGVADREVVWATLLHDVGKPATFSHQAGDRIRFNGHDQVGKDIAKDILRRLHFSRQFIDDVCWLIEKHMFARNFDKMRPAKRQRLALEPLMPKLLMVMKADLYGTEPQQLEFFTQAKKLYLEAKAKGLLEQNLRRAEIVSGKDIMDRFGIGGGIKVGVLKELARNAFLLEKVKDKEEALLWLERNLARIDEFIEKYPEDIWKSRDKREEALDDILQQLK